MKRLIVRLKRIRGEANDIEEEIWMFGVMFKEIVLLH